MHVPRRQPSADISCILGDAAYPLSEKILTPYRGKGLSNGKDSFNFYPSQLRVKIEQSFGILVSTWGNTVAAPQGTVRWARRSSHGAYSAVIFWSESVQGTVALHRFCCYLFLRERPSHCCAAQVLLLFFLRERSSKCCAAQVLLGFVLRDVQVSAALHRFCCFFWCVTVALQRFCRFLLLRERSSN